MKTVVVHLIFLVQKGESGQEKHELLFFATKTEYVKLRNPSCSGRVGESGSPSVTEASPEKQMLRSS